MIKKLMNFKNHIDVLATGVKYFLKNRRITMMYPEMTQLLPKDYRGFIRFYPDKCISCSLCARICPADAIKMHSEENCRFPGISYLRCIFCGFCVDVCPVGALEGTDVHDGAYYTREEQILSPKKFHEPPSTPQLKKIQRVKVKIDKHRGLRYERD
jgi:NADH-quinone oxidoreductase subunit I